MKTLGPLMERFFIQVIFKTILVLYILSLVCRLVVSMLVENISGLSAQREARVDELRWSLTGKNTMGPVQNLKMTSKSMENPTSKGS